MLLDEADETLAVTVARRALARLAEAAVVAGRELQVAASIGIAVHAGEGGGDELVRDADVAMYAAKDAGRGRHEVFRSEMARDPDELLGLDNDLRAALARREFSVHYQPEVVALGRRDRRASRRSCGGRRRPAAPSARTCSSPSPSRPA